MYSSPRIGARTDSSIRSYLSLPRAPLWRKVFLHPWLPPDIGKWLMLSDPSIAAAGAMKKMHYAFAFTSNFRGWHAIRELSHIKPIAGSRFIDIGCAYGGFVVAALNSGATQAVGIEINPHLAAIAIDNVSDNALDSKAQIIVGDALNGDFLDSLGKFDFVICNDVIEHVRDARLLVGNISSLLAPNGIAYLEIPNKRAASFLLSDGHYSLFGITVLPHSEAKQYYEHRFDGKTYEDCMGEYYELEEYIDWFGEEGCTVETLNAWRPKDALEKTQRDYAHFVAQLEAPRPDDIPGVVWDAILDQGMQFHKEFDADRRSMVDSDRFLQRYHDTFWRLIIRR